MRLQQPCGWFGAAFFVATVATAAAAALFHTVKEGGRPGHVASHVNGGQEKGVVEIDRAKARFIEQGDANVVGHPEQKPDTVLVRCVRACAVHCDSIVRRRVGVRFGAVNE